MYSLLYLNIIDLDEEIDIEDNNLSFSVDAGIINRLGLELVGRSETAVSELIKNSYDADATTVKVLFKNTHIVGGTLVIEDNGEGMDYKSLKNGFMRLSSTDKVHNPITKRFKRKKAGKKGIGRFSTQRLGSKLTIITKNEKMPMALKLVIKWDSYLIDTELSKIKNEVSYITSDLEYQSGTRITIDNLREAWESVEIRRVYRYISNLLQPDFLSDRSNNLNIATKKSGDNSFTVYCYRKTNEDGEVTEVMAPEKILFNKAIATIEGWVDKDMCGFCSIRSEKFELDDKKIPISSGKDKDLVEKFSKLNNIHFKAYYFIYNRPEYYDLDNDFTSLELKSIQKIADESSGVKLYRNGFRVYPYGEIGNDWLNIDRKLNKLRAESGINIPFGNQNLFGFIEIINSEDDKSNFEETASREGLIEDYTFKELQEFVYKTLQVSMLRIASADKFIETKKNRARRLNEKLEVLEYKREHFDDIKKSIVELQQKIRLDDPDKDEYLESFLKELPKQIDATKIEFEEKIKENGMLRVLAGIGLVIGEFVHEIEQFDTVFKSRIKFLKKKIIDSLLLGKVDELEEAFLAYQSYTAYFRASVSQNTKREISPINLKITVNSFFRQIENNSNKANIKIAKKFVNQYLFTCPMHPSEWLSILFNLYTNSKKAIRRNKSISSGKILLKVEEINSQIHFEFSDNGDGISDDIKEKIFLPFYTTSNPINSEDLDVKDNSGTGLGLYIVQKIISSYNGSIQVSNPLEGEYNTCIKIILPANV